MTLPLSSINRHAVSKTCRTDWQVAFENGRLEEFYVHCNCLTPEQMREDEVARALAVRRDGQHLT